jgi:hypothetical protein
MCEEGVGYFKIASFKTVTYRYYRTVQSKCRAQDAKIRMQLSVALYRTKDAKTEKQKNLRSENNFM